MFTGIVTDVGRIMAVDDADWGRRFRIETAYPAGSLDLGASIACSGACLTVVAKGTAQSGETSWFDVEATTETLDRTLAGLWQPGTRINLERPLKVGDELGGHMVSGHVDGIAVIIERQDRGEIAKYVLELPAALARYVAEKGSIALDGVSLTVNGVSGNRFTVMLIPHTLAVTTWGEKGAGDRVNVEVDQLARYLDRLSNA